MMGQTDTETTLTRSLPSSPSRVALIRAVGLHPTSPLACHIRRSLDEWAHLAATGHQPRDAASWRRAATGTALQWFETASDESAPPDGAENMHDIILDLHGLTPCHQGRLWRIVDGSGHCLLAPFFALDHCWRRPALLPMFLIESRDGGLSWHVLAEAFPSAAHHYRDLLDVAGRCSAWLIGRALRGPACLAAGAGRAWQPLSRPRPGRPSRLRRWAAGTGARWRDRLMAEEWAIAVLDKRPETLLTDQVVSPSHWIRMPVSQGFLADPFAWPGRPDVVLCEEFNHRTGRGILTALTTDGTRIITAEPIMLGETCHLSYPSTWQEGDRIFCLPEMAGARRQILYELAPGKPPAPFAVIVEGVAMADATLFRHDGRFWIAYTDTAFGLHDNLCLMYADCLEGPWRPCRANPVKIDIRSSRCGGTPFHVGDALYRPAQDCSATYGGALVVNRIVTCTPLSYEEVPVARIEPDPKGSFPHGLHTLSMCAGGVLIDGKRWVFAPKVVLQRLWRRLPRPRAGTVTGA